MSFACLVMLAHAVVPHHHHDNMACFVLPMDSEDAHDHDCCDQEEDHQEKHDADHTNDCCLLNDILAIIPDSYKSENLTIDFSCDYYDISHYSSIISASECEQGHEISYRDFRQKPFLDNSYEVYATHSLGLRAPPIC